jgi:hypothetical protein
LSEGNDPPYDALLRTVGGLKVVCAIYQKLGWRLSLPKPGLRFMENQSTLGELASLIGEGLGSADAPGVLSDLSCCLPVAGHVFHAALDNGEIFVCIGRPSDEAKKLHVIECHC